MKNQLFLVGKKGKSSNTSICSPKDLEGVTLLFRENGSATRMAMEAYLKKQKVQVNRSMELTSNEAVKQAVLAGLGYSIMPIIGIMNELKNEELEIIDLHELPLVTDWNLIWLKSKSLSPAAAAYLEYIEEKKEEIIQRHFSWYAAY